MFSFFAAFSEPTDNFLSSLKWMLDCERLREKTPNVTFTNCVSINRHELKAKPKISLKPM
jgi:hypothetical protein